MRRILQPGRNCWCFEPIEHAGLLIDGRAYFRAFYHAARQAQQSILISGWQFDSDTELLVDEDRQEADGEVRFLPFLNHLCTTNPHLQVRLLAWDFSAIYSLKRELLQGVVFNRQTVDNCQFRFDSAHPVGASHHQKFVVIDGWMGFVGGLDFCSGRWDTPAHDPEHPHRRDAEGNPQNPHHDIQAVVTGPAAARLTALFVQRWERAGGEPLSLGKPRRIKVSFPMRPRIRARQVAISRTQPRLLSPPVEPVREIRQLYLDAIAAARRLIFIENQYFSSQAIYQALLDRLRGPTRPALQIIMVLPKHNPGWLEEISMGVAEAKMLKGLQQAAAETPHSFGVFYPYRRDRQGMVHPVFVHSKLMIIDDRFLTVGSANTNNRSMGLDTELNVAWEATSARQRQLIRSICAARVALLAEHVGSRKVGKFRLRHARRLAKFLARLTQQSDSWLFRHPMSSLFEENTWLWRLCPDNLQIDPEEPIIEETLYETFSGAPDSLFGRGFSALKRWLQG